jgi:hypothetical protein
MKVSNTAHIKNSSIVRTLQMLHLNILSLNFNMCVLVTARLLCHSTSFLSFSGKAGVTVSLSFFKKETNLQHAEIGCVGTVMLLHAAWKQGHVKPRKEHDTCDKHGCNPTTSRKRTDEHVAEVLHRMGKLVAAEKVTRK